MVDQQYYSVTEAAHYLGVSVPTIRRWYRAGALPVQRVGPTGKIIRIHKDILDQMATPADPLQDSFEPLRLT